MGLDQNLYIKIYYSQYNEEDKDKIIKFAESDSLLAKNEPIEIKQSAIYWRKFNAIHKWFVDNCSGGEDNCAEMPVSRDQLIQLLNILKQIPRNKDKAHELLPTTNGFFFGGTDYDEYYFHHVEDSIVELRHLLKEACGTDVAFSYQASW